MNDVSGVCTGSGIPTQALAVTAGDRRHPLALLLVNITLLGGLLYRLTTRAVAYGSVPCATGPEGEEALITLLRAYKSAMKGKVLSTEPRSLSDLGNVQPVLNE